MYPTVSIQGTAVQEGDQGLWFGTVRSDQQADNAAEDGKLRWDRWSLQLARTWSRGARAETHTRPRQCFPLKIHPFLCRAVEQDSYLECVGACRPLDHHRVHHFFRVINILQFALLVPPSEPGLPRRVAPIPRGWGWWARRGGRGGRRERAAGPAVRAVPREAGVPGEVPPRGPRSAGGFSGDIDRLWVRRRGRALFMSVGCKTVCDVLLYVQGRGVLLFR